MRKAEAAWGGTTSTTPSGSWLKFCQKHLERSQYKLKVRMKEVSAVQEYRDANLDDSTYKRADISRLLRDDEVKDVVGKVKRV